MKARILVGTSLAFAVAIAISPVPPAMQPVVSAQAANASKLGDRSPFRAIVVDTAALVNNNDLPGGKV